ncbi:MAG: hypothetical protein ACI9FR_002378, partial [Cryomorphaceae bacterium]
KMTEMPPLFVEKLVNSKLLLSFLASIGDISSYFYFAPDLC